MADVVWTPLAAQELEDILYYIRIADGRPLTARRIGEEILALLGEYANQPLAGSRHEAAPNEWLYIRFKRWLFFYVAHDDRIEIMRVIDASRDLPAHLK